MQRQSGPPSAAKRKSKDSPGEPPGPAFRPPRFIVLEGPIRVGKSTLAKVLAERLHARRVFDCEDNPFLSDFYNEKPGAAFRAQMYFLMERHRRLHGLLPSFGHPTWLSISRPSRKFCGNASPRRAPAKKPRFHPNTLKRSCAPTNTFSSATPLPICWSSILRTLISSIATPISNSSFAASRTPSKGHSIFFPSDKADE